MSSSSEGLVKWEPLSGFPANLDPRSVNVVFGKNGGLDFTLEEPASNGRKFRVEFVRTLAFRSANESYRMRLIEPVAHLMPWNTFRIENSTWIEWFHNETYGAYRDWNVKHFVFLGEDVIEVLSRVEPRFLEIED